MRPTRMASIAQLVRAPDCDSGGRGFETLCSPSSSMPQEFTTASRGHREVRRDHDGKERFSARSRPQSANQNSSLSLNWNTRGKLV